MEFRDQTEIKDRGINLSDGQKQCIQLLLELFIKIDIYLLEDVFSADTKNMYPVLCWQRVFLTQLNDM
ncbi:ABC transporter C family member 14 [Bienertia sinuspersici]